MHDVMFFSDSLLIVVSKRERERGKQVYKRRHTNEEACFLLALLCEKNVDTVG